MCILKSYKILNLEAIMMVYTNTLFKFCMIIILINVFLIIYFQNLIIKNNSNILLIKYFKKNKVNIFY